MLPPFGRALVIESRTMLLALVLMIAAPDHWNFQVGWLHFEGDDHHHLGTVLDSSHPTGSEESHERHCHGNLDTCSDIPLTTVGGLALLAGWLIAALVIDWRRGARLTAILPLSGRAIAVTPPPPRIPSLHSA
jgi:hypothetical protein